MIYQVVSVGVLLLVSMLFSVNMFNSHQMTSGDFVLISSYIIELSTPLILIAQSLMQTNGHFVSIEKLKKYFENPKDDIDNRNIKLNKFYYIFKEVVFKMNGNYILKDFNFSICEGDFIVINGETGVGKSSFINLLLGINKIQAGQLFFGNIDISKTFSINIYKELAYVPQKSFIFTGSVRDNMLYNNNITYTDDDIISFLKEFNLYKILINNKIDLDSSIDELFKFFSGGELQRFNIIRALLRKPKILILDEPTSGLDIVMSRKVIDVIKKHISTVIMISHSVDFIDEASQVLNLPIDNS
ncbi:ABC transporter ATP-binding protein [Acinetobacter seifertii]|uniref:ABC transporter ATP-binding protein n=1 Tax=Acinetobacter seifertii TaxID=1530123 RepID=UPI00168B8A07|nr:ABC transporter ATP-binding protein [Acinetobacter seifertii]QNX88240.1 ABC transporter ATP-binding protein [Acinetobacter seifertii]